MPDENSLWALWAAASSWTLVGIVTASGALSLLHYELLPKLAPVPDEEQPVMLDHLPSVSIIVPARNEERNLPRLLPTLLALDYPDYEVLVVDDASTDATAAIAQAAAHHSIGRLRVITSTGPPPGWTGKAYACALGAREAHGAWLLFTDADTTHTRDSLMTAVRMALTNDAPALTAFARQRCKGFWEQLLLPFAYQQYFTGVRPAGLRMPDGPALANGQYILVRRAAYGAVGGHGAVATSVIDDVALAGALKQAGFVPLVCRGERYVAVRMYESLPALAEGFTKNATPFIREQGATGLLVAVSTAASSGVLPALALAVLAGSRTGIVGAALAYVAQAGLYLPWVRRFGAPAGYALLAPLAAPVFTMIAASSMLRSILRRPVTWKGRRIVPAPREGAPMPAETPHAEI